MPRKQKSAAPRPLKVLAAVIIKRGRILIARRKSTDRFGGQWEFPGGKLEAGETPKDGLARELKEEFGIEAGVGRFLGSVRSASPGFAILLGAYEVIHLSGEFELREHDEIRWVRPSEIAGFELTEPDLRLLDRIFKKQHRETSQ
jgi:8-oxo-dGTP diphosphatase